MDTDKTAKPYIKHAEYFRALLGVGPVGCVALFADDLRLFVPNEMITSWHTGQQSIVTEIAVAAMTEAWRAELQKTPDTLTIGRGGRGWCGGLEVYDTLPEAICAEVEHRVAKKRAKAADDLIAVVKRGKKCPECKGTGFAPVLQIGNCSLTPKNDKCGRCGGTGMIADTDEKKAAQGVEEMGFKRVEDIEVLKGVAGGPAFFSNGAVPIVLPEGQPVSPLVKASYKHLHSQDGRSGKSGAQWENWELLGAFVAGAKWVSKNIKEHFKEGG